MVKECVLSNLTISRKFETVSVGHKLWYRSISVQCTAFDYSIVETSLN